MISSSRDSEHRSDGDLPHQDAPTPSPLNTGTNMNRRAFFKSLAGRSADIGMTAVAGSCGYISVDCISSLASIATFDQDMKKEPVTSLIQDNASTSYFTVRHPNGAAIDVIGLKHTEEHYAQCKDILTARVSPADIVLFEQGGFFERNFRDPARARGKVSAPVEGMFTNVKASLFMGTALWLCAFKLSDGVKRGIYFLATALRPDNSRRLDPEHKVKRRAALKDLLTMNAYLYVGLGGGQTLADRTQNQHYMLADVSHLKDGRSMKMWANAITWAEKNPGARIAVVVGDGHARQIRFYTSTPAGRIAFAIKNPIYNVVYLNCLDSTT